MTASEVDELIGVANDSIILGTMVTCLKLISEPSADGALGWAAKSALHAEVSRSVRSGEERERRVDGGGGEGAKVEKGVGEAW